MIWRSWDPELLINHFVPTCDLKIDFVIFVLTQLTVESQPFVNLES